LVLVYHHVVQNTFVDITLNNMVDLKIMKTITLTPEEYIQFCLIVQQQSCSKVQFNTIFIKQAVKITATIDFLEELGY